MKLSGDIGTVAIAGAAIYLLYTVNKGGFTASGPFNLPLYTIKPAQGGPLPPQQTGFNWSVLNPLWFLSPSTYGGLFK